MRDEDKKAILDAFDDKTAIILEELDRKFFIFLENKNALIDSKLMPLKVDILEIKSDGKIVKATISETNKDLKQLDTRITKLENQIA